MILTKLIFLVLHRNVRAPHYKLVGECLLAAISDVLGPEIATDDVISAWRAAYGFLAETFVAIEKAIRAEASQTAGYEGYKAFRIVSVTAHKNGAKTFAVVPADGNGQIPPHSGGQFISFELLDVPEVGKSKSSAMLSDVSTESLVFTIYPPGPGEVDRPTEYMLTQKVGAELNLSVPCGTFKIDSNVVAKLTNVTVATTKIHHVGVVAAVAKSLRDAGAKSVKLIVPDGDCVLDISLTVEVIDTPLTVEHLFTPATDGIFVTPELAELAKSMVSRESDAVGNTSSMHVAVIE
jgi:hypothetical protein